MFQERHGKQTVSDGRKKLGALPVFSRIQALITSEDFIKDVIVKSTTQPEHFVAIDDIPQAPERFIRTWQMNLLADSMPPEPRGYYPRLKRMFPL
jgi:hypothetical protein